MKTLGMIFTLALSIMMFSGCSKQVAHEPEKPHLVGSWKLSSVETNPEDLSATVLSTRCDVTFRPDGTTKITLWGGEVVTDLIEGRYAVEGDQLVISGTTIAKYRADHEFVDDDLVLHFTEKDMSIRMTFKKTKL